MLILLYDYIFGYFNFLSIYLTISNAWLKTCLSFACRLVNGGDIDQWVCLCKYDKEGWCFRSQHNILVSILTLGFLFSNSGNSVFDPCFLEKLFVFVWFLHYFLFFFLILTLFPLYWFLHTNKQKYQNYRNTVSCYCIS